MMKTETSTGIETPTQPVPLLDLQAQYKTIRDELREAMDRVAESQHFILGPEVEALEREIPLDAVQMLGRQGIESEPR